MQHPQSLSIVFSFFRLCPARKLRVDSSKQHVLRPAVRPPPLTRSTTASDLISSDGGVAGFLESAMPTSEGYVIADPASPPHVATLRAPIQSSLDYKSHCSYPMKARTWRLPWPERLQPEVHPLKMTLAPYGRVLAILHCLLIRSIATKAVIVTLEAARARARAWYPTST